MRRDSERLQDIFEAIKRIQDRANLDQIEDDEMLQVFKFGCYITYKLLVKLPAPSPPN
ncbi:hypothetical protein PN462_07615 [Spirulina sp. CS-785/01]|uniref:hypothetical protein n=1 Tax=Spirulina sp. CS-785/01 TaxID=3021716 RepID=UPI00232B6310|nr:hypothetical protein [Spirulina sp. CS-785/01]MDB9312964.1 hypothetical protein [Spirulina sp. CS-785/01]